MPTDERVQTISQRLLWAEAARLFVALFSMILLSIWQMGREYFIAAYSLLLAVALIDLVFVVVRRSGAVSGERLARVELTGDVLWITLLLYLTGGVTNFFSLLYFFVIMAAAMIIGWRWSMGTASAATIAMAVMHIGMLVGSHLGVRLPLIAEDLVEETRLRWNFVVANLVAHAVAFHLVAGLAALLDRELRRVRIVYEEIVEDMAEGLVAIDHEGRIVVVNGAARRLLRYGKPDRLTGRHILEVFRRQADKRILEILLSFEATRCEIEVDTREGDPLAVEVSTSVIRDEADSRVRGIVGVLRDLTTKRRLEEAERRASRLEEVEEVAMGLAHEIRNPLASIRGSVQELTRADGVVPGTEDALKLAGIVCRESDRLDDIVQRFLSFAKMRPQTYRPVDLRPLVEEVAILLRHRVDADGIDIKTEVSTDGTVFGDATQLRQVFLNLGINAIEAMASDGDRRTRRGGSLRIGVREAAFSQRIVAEKDQWRSTLSELRGVEIEFRDTGPGIPEHLISRIFTPFFTTKPSGTGLGLPTVNKIVQSHGGHVMVKTQASGTSFRVWLPTERSLVVREAEGAEPGSARTTGVLGPSAPLAAGAPSPPSPLPKGEAGE